MYIYNDNENEIIYNSLPKAARTFFGAKKMKNKITLTWTSEIIQFIRYLMIQMDRTKRYYFFGGNDQLFIANQLCYD